MVPTGDEDMGSVLQMAGKPGVDKMGLECVQQWSPGEDQPRRCLRKVFDEVCDPLVARVIEGGSWCQWEGSNNTAESEQQRKSGT